MCAFHSGAFINHVACPPPWRGRMEVLRRSSQSFCGALGDVGDATNPNLGVVALEGPGGDDGLFGFIGHNMLCGLAIIRSLVRCAWALAQNSLTPLRGLRRARRCSELEGWRCRRFRVLRISDVRVLVLQDRRLCDPAWSTNGLMNLCGGVTPRLSRTLVFVPKLTIPTQCKYSRRRCSGGTTHSAFVSTTGWPCFVAPKSRYYIARVVRATPYHATS